MILPEIDPVAIQLGPLAIRWYSLSWLAAFGLIFFLANKNLNKFSKEQLSNLMFYGLLGAIVGGRAGYMIFYGSNQLLADPLSLIYVWQGGLSFHGGFLGVLVSAYFLSKHWHVKFFEIMDFIAATFSCKAAIKAGDRLDESEMKSLIDKLFNTDQPYYCPHGRPIIINLGIQELDTRFERKW